jgi:hypothetical protein
VERDLLIGHELQVGPASQESLESQLRLELAEDRTDAEVDALAERERVAGILTGDVEALRLREDVGVVA